MCALCKNEFPLSAYCCTHVFARIEEDQSLIFRRFMYASILFYASWDGTLITMIDVDYQYNLSINTILQSVYYLLGYLNF